MLSDKTKFPINYPPKGGNPFKPIKRLETNTTNPRLRGK